MRAINRKILRDLVGMRGQALAIALVVASGAATYIMSVSTLDALESTLAAYYREYRFADGFAPLKRAPRSVAARLREIPGIQMLETRVLAAANLTIDNFDEPVSAQIVSIPESGPLLNAIYLRSGRMPDPSRDNEVLVSDSFASAHQFRAGTHFYATINGRRRRLEITGIAFSPEFIYQVQPGALIPDFKTFGILWMPEDALAAAYDMEGAFNDVTFSIERSANIKEIIDRMDEILARYGGLGAYGREDQLSNKYLSSEFDQLRQMAVIFPAIFYGVAAFLLNIVITRVIATQREQMGVLKAFGYATTDLVLHYLALVAMIIAAGIAGGIALGAWLGQALGSLYMEYYRFPFLLFHLRPDMIFVAALISGVAAGLGTLHAVYRAASLPPAVAMQPPVPPRYRRSFLESLPLARSVSQPTRMIVRNLERRPLKSVLSILGVAAACAILVVGTLFSDSVDYIVRIQFQFAQHDDLNVIFNEPASAKAISSLKAMPGVRYAEPFRSVPVRLRFEQRSYRTSIQGLPHGAVLRRVLDSELKPAPVQEHGLLLTDYLAGILHVRPGDTLTVETLEGERRVLRLPLVAVAKEFVGVGAYMELEALNRAMGEAPSISGAYMETDSEHDKEIYAELREMPRVAGAGVRANALRNFYETMAKQALTFAFFNTLLAASIAFGVVYNSARIGFSERSRELASLRVLGFTRFEVAYILLGELAVLTVAAIPIGFFMGRGLGAFMISNVQTDLFRVPVIVDPSTYAFAAIVVLASALISGAGILRKIYKLDLVEVLKVRE
ncbi:MAG: ABC transporter permease [Bryobacterales bacterium]|nr:ABC transporter permease [Bryobacterales bacterium]